MLRIRLRRVGKKKQPMYRIVVADSRAPRDGRFVESLGYYHPLNNPSTIELDQERARHWLDHGAQPSDRVAKILAIKGVQELPAKLKARIALGEQRAKDAAAEKSKAKAEAAADEAPKAPADEPPKAEAAPEAKASADEPPKAEAAPEAKASADEPPKAEAAPEAKASADEAPKAEGEKAEAKASADEAPKAPADAAPGGEEQSGE